MNARLRAAPLVWWVLPAGGFSHGPRRAERCAFSYTAVEPSALVAGVRRLNRKHCKVASCHCSNRTITSPPPAHAPLPIQSVCNAAQPRPAPSLSGRPRTSHRREGRSSASTSSGAAAFPPSSRPISASAAAAEPPGYRTSGGRPSTWPPPRRRRLGWTWRRQIWMVSLADLIPLDVLFTAWLAVYKGSSIMLHWPGPGLYYVDSEGAKLVGNMFSVGSGSLYAYGILDEGMSVEEAGELARQAIYGATFCDAATGGCASVYHVGLNGWKKLSGDDLGELHYHYYPVQKTPVEQEMTDAPTAYA